MKISELLDDYDESELDIKMETPLSSERVRELTMSKIKEDKKPKRIAFRVLIAAAIMMALTVTVFAAGNGAAWFREFFARGGETELSDGQMEFIESNAVMLNESQTVNGYTVTLESYISDGSMAYLKMNIQAPEGVEMSRSGYRFESMAAVYPDGEPACGFLSWALQEKNEDTGESTYILDLNFIMDDGREDDPVILELTDLYNGAKLTEGTWRFEIVLPDTAIELIDEPFTCPLAHTGEGESISITITAVRLRAMGIEIMYEPSALEMFEEHHFWTIQAVMQDGSVIEFLPSGWGKASDSEETDWWVEYHSDILSLDEIVCIELPGGVQIPVNEP